MYVADVDAIFIRFCNEDDPTFLDPAQRAIWLARGYAQFRTFVRSYDPNFYRAEVTLSLVNQDSYNLATGTVQILGDATTLTAARLSSIGRVESVDASGNWLWDYDAAASLAELRILPNSYLLQGQSLYFWARETRTIRLVYCPVSAVDWTEIDAIDLEDIDDLDEFHDLIALYAYLFYAVTDGASNRQVAELRKDREGALRRHLSIGRNPGASDHVAAA